MNNIAVNYKKVFAIKRQHEEKIKSVCPNMPHKPGIYVFYRDDESGLKKAYCGQAVDLISRCGQHLGEYDHIALSLKKRGFYNKDNPYGWKLMFKECAKEKLDDNERLTILRFGNNGYQLFNATSGGQNQGKLKINEYRPAKGYHDGLKQGYRNASKEIAHLMDLHLVVTTKQNPPTKNQAKALEKFNDFLNYHKDNGKRTEIEDE